MIKEKEYLGYVYDVHDSGTDHTLWGYVIYCPYSSNEIFNSECNFTYFDDADKEAKKKIEELHMNIWLRLLRFLAWIK